MAVQSTKGTSGTTGTTSSAPADPNAVPTKTDRNAFGPHNPLKDPFKKAGPAALTSADGAKAREKKLMDGATARGKEVDDWHAKLKDARKIRQDAEPDFASGDLQSPDYWKKLDQQYMPDSKTLGNKDNSKFEGNLAINKTQVESGLTAFQPSSAAKATLEGATKEGTTKKA